MGPSKIQTRALVSSPNVLTTRLNTLFCSIRPPACTLAGYLLGREIWGLRLGLCINSYCGIKLDPDPHVYDLDSHVYVTERCRRSVGRPVPNTAQRRPGPLLFHFSLICPSQLKHYVRSHSIQLRLYKLHRSPISMHFSG
ncbi:hypothetical protein GW17_00000251 [Ensete ventricosum]|nr:hypothetical protein GW17_00000251 [Ensete ventricosum]RZS06390.1 hypothetical protein BHM03_00037033 [Ensete ventricosum]